MSASWFAVIIFGSDGHHGRVSFLLVHLSPSFLSIFFFSSSPVFIWSALSSSYHLAKDGCQGQQQETENPNYYITTPRFFILYVSIPSTSRLYDSSENYISVSLSAAPERLTQTQYESSWVNIASVFCCAFISVLSQSTFSNSWGWRPGMRSIASHKHAHNGLLSLLLSAAGAVKNHGRVQCISISKEAGNVCENMNVCVCVCPGAV